MSVLVFDSGVGGVGVVTAMRALMPGTAICYLMDDAGFPYGSKTDADLRARILHVVRAGMDRVRPSLAVIACNTASTVALDALRAQVPMPFVGCVPPVRTAAAISTTGVFGVLATPATVRGRYLGALAERHAPGCRMLVHGAARLAALAERRFAGGDVDVAAVQDELKGLLGQDGADMIDAVALGCTHYALLLPELQACLPGHVTWLDPAAAVARQAWRLSRETGVDAADADVDGLVLCTGGFLDVAGEGWENAGLTRSDHLDVNALKPSLQAALSGLMRVTR
jgi:glutamate racemase